MENKRIPKLITRGLKVLAMECMGVKIIDSFSFLPQSLDSLPKTFNQPHLVKGYSIVSSISVSNHVKYKYFFRVFPLPLQRA